MSEATLDRHTALDVLRGVALLGILPMNVQALAMPFSAYTNPASYGDLTGSFVDQLATRAPMTKTLETRCPTISAASRRRSVSSRSSC